VPYKAEYPTAQELTNALGGQWSRTRGSGMAKCPAHDARMRYKIIRVHDRCSVAISHNSPRGPHQVKGPHARRRLDRWSGAWHVGGRVRRRA
jgi:hypothetical protein